MRVPSAVQPVLTDCVAHFALQAESEQNFIVTLDWAAAVARRRAASALRIHVHPQR